MANTKKESTASTTSASTAAKTVKPAVDKEKEELKAQLAEQQKKMDELMAQIGVLMKAQSAVSTAPVAQSGNKQVTFVNLTTGGLTLKGTRMHHLDKQFAKKSIQESEARAIASNMPNTIANGYVYIPDEDFLESVNMGGIYDGMLTDEQLKTLLNQDANYVCDVYKNATDSQKQIIVDMVSNRQFDGKQVDANILVKLGKLCGVDFLSIEPLDDKE